MPRLPKDYSKALIYKLCSKDPTIKEIYIGSTTNFVKRKQSHKKACNSPNIKGHHYKVYQFIREHGGWDNFDMILIEYYPCTTELELGRRENHFKNELKASLNTRTPPIYDDKPAYHKQYREVNKKILMEKKREQITCECGCIVNKNHIQRHRRSNRHLNLINLSTETI